jgi:hypothetical protein
MAAGKYVPHLSLKPGSNHQSNHQTVNAQPSIKPSNRQCTANHQSNHQTVNAQPVHGDAMRAG